MGSQCPRLTLLRLDASARSHKALVLPLTLPRFSRLSSFTLWCSTGGGLEDLELEAILAGRGQLQTLAPRRGRGRERSEVLRNCAISEGLFPRWCHKDTAPLEPRRRPHTRNPAATALRTAPGQKKKRLSRCSAR